MVEKFCNLLIFIKLQDFAEEFGCNDIVIYIIPI